MRTILLILGLLGKCGWMHGGGCMWLKLPCGCYGGFLIDFFIISLALWGENHLGFWLGWLVGRGGGHACLFDAFGEGLYNFLELFLCIFFLLGVSCLWCTMFVRLSISSLFSSKNIVWSFWRLVGGCDMGVVGR